MGKETKEFIELMRTLGIALAAIMAVPLAYRAYVYFWPPEEKPHQTLAEFLKEAESASCIKLLTKPISKWSAEEVKAEPEIHAWLKEQGDTILPWEWTEEARRKDSKGYAKCWRRIWEARRSHCEKLLAKQRKEIKRLNRERQVLVAIHTHRTNQIARLRAFAATNTFPCQVALERLEEGRFWGWNKKVEMVECKDAAAIFAVTNSICSREAATAHEEDKNILALANSMSSSEKELAVCEKMHEICNDNVRLIEDMSAQDEVLKKALVENLIQRR